MNKIVAKMAANFPIWTPTIFQIKISPIIHDDELRLFPNRRYYSVEKLYWSIYNHYYSILQINKLTVVIAAIFQYFNSPPFSTIAISNRNRPISAYRVTILVSNRWLSVMMTVFLVMIVVTSVWCRSCTTFVIMKVMWCWTLIVIDYRYSN